MIASFGDKETERLWRSGNSRRLRANLQLRAFKKLAILNAAVSLDNLKVPPGNQLDVLRGDRIGSIVFGSAINTGCVLFGETETLLTSR